MTDTLYLLVRRAAVGYGLDQDQRDDIARSFIDHLCSDERVEFRCEPCASTEVLDTAGMALLGWIAADRTRTHVTWIRARRSPSAPTPEQERRLLADVETNAARWREHSIVLNRAAWRIAEALGDIEPDAEIHESDVDADLDRLLGRIAAAEEVRSDG